MSLKSAIYTGKVRHRRRAPAHEFTFPLFMVYLDLSEIDRVLSLTRLWGRSRLCPARFRREDYLSRGGLGLEESVRECVREHTGRRPGGPIRMLTHLRYYGHIFNPVTFYYCFDHEERLETVVAEITNTPWKERHTYVVDAGESGSLRGRSIGRKFGKEFHISPFMPMEIEYDWRFTPPAESLCVHMACRERGGGRERAFDATLRMERREITAGLLRRLVILRPFMTLRVVAAIHVQALRLFLKGAKVYRHPRAKVEAATPAPKGVAS